MTNIVNNEAARQFEVTIDGHTGFLRYAKTGERLDLLHTEVPKELGGRGLGGMLAQEAFEFARANGLRVIATCPFVRKYVEKNPEYAALVA